MASQHEKIISLHELGERNCDIARRLKCAPGTVSRSVKRFRELGHTGRRPGQGRKRTVRTARNRERIRERVRRDPRVSMRKVARDTGINDRSVRRIAKEDLHLKPYKLHKAQLLTAQNKLVRLERCRQLLASHANPRRWPSILFTDEKLFTIEQFHNHQNDRIWSADSPGSSGIVEHRQNPKAVMVWAGICATGKTPLIFVDQGVKINQEVYRRDILEAEVLPWPVGTSAKRAGPFNKTLLRPTGRETRRSGARPIFPASSRRRNGRRTRPTSTQWTTAYGQFWRRGPVLSPTKVWRS